MDSILILMMFIPSVLLFTLILFVSVFLVISTPSWLGAWVGLEVNLISFIPVILSRWTIPSVERCIKYFLVQAFSSLLMLISILMSIGGITLVWNQPNVLTTMLAVALLIKLGAAPFHYWFPAVAAGVGWYQNFLLITVQKIGPLIILRYIWGTHQILILVVGASVIVGGVGGLNQSSLRKLMAYSSINHLGWLLVACGFGLKFILIYFIIYSLTNLILVRTLHFSGVYYLSQVYYYNSTGVLGVLIILIWFSFGGLPPFVGFLGKWMVIRLIVESQINGLCFLIIIISLVSLYYYTRVCYTIIRQSSNCPLVWGGANSKIWWANLHVVILLLSLIAAPIFVVVL